MNCVKTVKQFGNKYFVVLRNGNRLFKEYYNHFGTCSMTNVVVQHTQLTILAKKYTCQYSQ